MDDRQSLSTTSGALEGRAQPELDALKAKLGAANDQVVTWVRAHPTQCVLGAVALGFLVGRLARGGWFGARAS